MHKVKHWKLPTNGHTVLWSSTAHYYLTFSSVSSMSHWYKQIPHPHYNEVIRKDVPRKLFFDLDDEPDLNAVLAVLSEFFDDIVIFCTSPNRYHLVVLGYYTTSHYTSKAIAQYFHDNYNITSIDMSCYASVKCIRLENSYKGLYKKTKWTSHSFSDGLITCVQDDAEELNTSRVPQKITVPRTLTDTTNFQVRKQCKNITYLDRIAPSYCKLCHRIHDNENAAIINDKFVCWRYVNRNKS
jgi:hypothetical protein